MYKQTYRQIESLFIHKTVSTNEIMQEIFHYCCCSC